MRIVTRIQMSALPATVGLITVALLAYFGEYHRQAPAMLVALVALAAVASSLLAWHNARVLVHRVKALAAGVRALGVATPATRPPADEFDELDDIRHIVQQWVLADEGRRTAAAERVAAADRRVAEYEALLRSLSAEIQTRLEEARLALHILQTSPFGDLNENQEELVAAARAAAEQANDDLQTLHRLASVTSAAASMSTQSCSFRTLIEVPLAMALGGADAVAASTRLVVPDDVPLVQVPLTAAHEALAILLKVSADALEPGTRLTIEAQTHPDQVDLILAPFPPLASPPPLRVALALRLLGHQIAPTTSLTLSFPRREASRGLTP